MKAKIYVCVLAMMLCANAKEEGIKKMLSNTQKVVCNDIYGKTYEVAVDQLSFRPSVYGVIINDGKILLSRQWGGYDFPGGGIELGETVEQALIREVKEETGLEVRVGHIITAGNSFFKFPFGEKYVQAIVLYYWCEVIGGTLSADFLDECEKQYADKPEWIDIKEIEKIKFYSAIDSVKLIHEAARILNS